MVNDRATAATYARGLYPVGAALVLFPLSDIASRMIPPNFGNIQWRFAGVGLTLSSMSILIIGVSLLGFVAALRDNRGLLRVLAIFSGLVAILLIAALGLFSLDTLQLRGMIRNPAAKPQLAKMALSAGIAGTLHLIAFAGLAVALWRATRRSSVAKAAAAPKEAPVLVYSAGSE